jgi:hypothetical protein
MRTDRWCSWPISRLVRRPWQPVTVGVLVPTLVALAVYVLLLVRSMLRHPTLDHLIALLFLWQTQTGAAFAVAAAFIGAAVILHQTAATRQLEETRRMRRAAGLRAVLPLALSELCDYAARCAEISAGLLAQPNSSPVRALGLIIPSLPDGLVSALTDLIEASEPDHAKPLIALVRQVQIQHARMRDMQRRAGSQTGSLLLRANVVGRVIDSAEVYARCESLFAYARGEATAPAAPIKADDVKRALFPMPTGLADTSELESEIDRYAKDGQNGSGWPAA